MPRFSVTVLPPRLYTKDGRPALAATVVVMGGSDASPFSKKVFVSEIFEKHLNETKTEAQKICDRLNRQDEIAKQVLSKQE